MAQPDIDYIIGNQTAANLRADLNNVLEAIVSNNSGDTAPPDIYANMFWYDTSANILKMRNETNDAWISLGYLDQTSDAFRILDDTQVVNTSGTQTGLLGDQSTATWEAGVGTTESLVSPAKVKAAIDSQVTTTFVNTVIASSSVGAVGTYAFLGAGGITVDYGQTIPGSSLTYRGVSDNPLNANTNQVLSNGVSPDGTWMAMGYLHPFQGAGWQAATLFLRVS